MDINLKKAKIFNVLTEVGDYKLRLPNMALVKVFQTNMVKAEESGGSAPLDCIQELLASLGMPLKASDTLDMDQMEVLISALMPKKKD